MKKLLIIVVGCALGSNMINARGGVRYPTPLEESYKEFARDVCHFKRYGDSCYPSISENQEGDVELLEAEGHCIEDSDTEYLTCKKQQ